MSAGHGHLGSIETNLQQLEALAPGSDEYTTVSGNDVVPDVIISDIALLDTNSSDVDTPSPFTFPKGATPGTFLHDILEGKALKDVLEKRDLCGFIKSPASNSYDGLYKETRV